MFWIFTSFAGLMVFAVTLGQISVWFALLKIALTVAAIVIVLMGAMLVSRKNDKSAK